MKELVVVAIGGNSFIGGFAVAAGDRCTGGLSDIILLNTEDG